MKRPLLLAISVLGLGLVLGGAGGYFAGSRIRHESVGPTAITLAELQAKLDEGVRSEPGVRARKREVELLERLAVSDLPSLAGQIATGPAGPDFNRAWSMVMTVLVEQDPLAAWEFANRLEDRRFRGHAISVVMSYQVGRDPDRTLALAEKIEDPELKKRAWDVGIANLASTDPGRAFEIWFAQGPPKPRDSILGMIFGAWARVDPDAAMAALSRLDGSALEVARRNLLMNLAKYDPPKAMRLALEISDKKGDFDDPCAVVAESWAESDPVPAMQAALAVPEPRVRKNAIRRAMSAWARMDFPAALQYVENVPDPALRAVCLSSISSSVKAGSRGEYLDALLKVMPDGPELSGMLSKFFADWATENPQQASVAVARVSAGPTRAEAIFQIAAVWARDGSAPEALAWVKQLPEADVKGGTWDFIFGGWMGKDAKGAVAALAEVPVKARPGVIRWIVLPWAKNDPKAALSWLESLSESSERLPAICQLMSTWGRADPAAATAALSTLRDADRPKATLAVVSEWSQKDAPAAARWISSQPAGPDRDAGIPFLSRMLAEHDAAGAIEWLYSLGEVEKWDKLVKELAEEWMQRDRLGARRWIEASSLSPEEKDRLLTR